MQPVKPKRAFAFSLRVCVRDRRKFRAAFPRAANPAAAVPLRIAPRPILPTRRVRNPGTPRACGRTGRRTRCGPARREAPRSGRRALAAWPCGRRRPARSGAREPRPSLRRPPRPSRRMSGRPRSRLRSPGRGCATVRHGVRPSSGPPFPAATACPRRTAK